MHSLNISKSPSAAENEKKMSSYQRWIFLATFINYAMAHWTRKSYTNVKVQLMQNGVSPLTLTAMDSGFMFTYAFGSFITGQLGDRFSPVGVVGGGLLGSTVCLLLIIYGASTTIIHNAALCGTWFLTCQLLHGAFQATGGPVNTAIMGSWYSSKGRGLIFGLWTCHQYIGDIFAAIASAYILHNGIDWRLCIVIPAVVNGLWAFINFFQVPNRPEDVGLGNADASKTSSRITTSEGTVRVVEDTPAPIGFIQAFMLPNVMSYAIAFGFFKLVNYAMFFQLPVILSSHFDPVTSNVISALYSVGMMPGGIVCGWVSDLYGGRRACVIATFMGVLCPLLWVFAIYMSVIPIYLLLFLLAFMGCLVGGPNNIITSAVAADLADDPSIKGNNRALGTVTGIINGSGSVTAAMGQLAIPVLYSMGKANGVEYRYVWFFLIFCTVIGTSLMGPKIFKELYDGTETAPLLSTSASRQGYSAIETREEKSQA